MSTPLESFVDRRDGTNPGLAPLPERRQFANSGVELSSEAQRLANAVDRYKFQHLRRYISYEEILAIIKSLGYRQMDESEATNSST